MIGYARVEGFARALARAAGLDPDELIDDTLPCDPLRPAQPCFARIPAWHRYRCAAERACVVHDVLSERLRATATSPRECT